MHQHERAANEKWKRELCASRRSRRSLRHHPLVTIVEKFAEGAWVTLAVTLGLTLVCFAIKRHYGLVVRAIRRLDRELPGPEDLDARAR